MYKLKNSPLNRLKIGEDDIATIVSFNFLNIKKIFLCIWILLITKFIIDYISNTPEINTMSIFIAVIMSTIGCSLMTGILYLLTILISDFFKKSIFYRFISWIYYIFGRRTLRKIISEIDNFNENTSEFIKNSVISQRKLSPEDEKEAIEQILKIKKHILDALKTETILRICPDKNPQDSCKLFEYNYEESSRINLESSNYKKIYEENIRIASSVNREMNKLIN